MADQTLVYARALGYLRVTEVGELPTSDETAILASILPDLVLEWTGNRIVDIVLPNIPDAYVPAVSRLLANRAAPEFGRPGDPDIDMREQQRLLNLQTKYSRRRGVGAVAL